VKCIKGIILLFIKLLILIISDGELMGLSKKDLSRKKANLKARLAELEKKAKMDPLKRDKSLHFEIEELKKKIEKK